MAIGVNHRCQLSLDHRFGVTRLAFGQTFTHTHDGRDAGSQSTLRLGGYKTDKNNQALSKAQIATNAESVKRIANRLGISVEEVIGQLPGAAGAGQGKPKRAEDYM
jgi:hypothetical protein